MALSDGGIQTTMPVTPANNYGGGMGAWGQDWIWIIVLFLFGWGNGFGGFGGNGGAADNYVLASDFATLQRQIDSSTASLERKSDATQQGLCDGFYAMNTGILNGFSGVNQTINSGFSSAELSRANQQAALMQQLFQMQMQSQECCCENRAAIAQVRYDMATQSCDTRNTVQNTTRDIIDSMNAGFRGIEQRLTAQEIAQKDAKIAEQNQQLFAAQLAASQAAQNNYLVTTLRPTPVPAYQSCNPWASNAPLGCCTSC